ncbi:inositol monophosphatase family protein [Kitasatospora sp. HPMI-4]|uniref:inositol monophosphatase family protein n=1 Tax=Kitasatospora sp. HPMI-4 TaxID=3448443 RepID=UPI003F1BD291
MLDERSVGSLAGTVEEIIRHAAAAEIMPRFRKLAADQVAEKRGPHDLVTIADRSAEEYLSAALTDILPGSVVVGEEAVHADPGVYDALRGDVAVWIIDPIDGTRPFVQGEAGFCTLVALAHRGEVLASWTYAPALGEMATAIRGRGARLNGTPLQSGSPTPGATLEVATSHPDYTTPEQKRSLLRLKVDGMNTRPCAGSAGLEYVAIARGDLDATAFCWENAWDHAAGLLLVTEAGGAQTTVSGRPFRIEGGNELPLAAARDADTAARVRKLLAGV